ncbi:polysaccharide pyruvyl transferase family protein [Alteromonas halophila]|uniref:Polysaccharide pyruvyl transferase domain-containing protein n=1 Tax=Alteromonas halophila TaxID=516698 RepID=A0A918MZI9_9ALTE|nr:polysaccharide pyruvyl transferase family protein [Alteromonas halophila]GGW92547.1 hypothetical protein GCM10007391_28660 [Alteromonas halophila]
MANLMGLGSGNNQLVTGYNELVRAASGNTGNLLFNYTLEQLIELDGADVKWSTPADTLNSAGHTLLLPMANNIGKHMDLMKSGPKLEGVNVHAVAMGLGAQFQLSDDFDTSFEKIPDASKAWLKLLCERSDVANVSVRGDLTHKVFERLGLGDKAVPLGCPSHFLSNNKQLGQLLKSKSQALTPTLKNGVTVTAGNPAIKNLAKLEQFLIGLINTHGGRYVVQSPKNLICLAENWLDDVSEADVEDVRDAFFPGDATPSMHNWFRQHATTYLSIPQWFSDISKADFVVGTRIHGCQIALQAGVPAVCLHIDSRTKELCETMQIPTLHARDFQRNPSLETLLDTVQNWDWDAYDDNRLNLARRTFDFVTQNGLTPSKKFAALLR